ncbi:glycosyltransferase family 1 protein [uncultured Modestobacter sp.]|uniref:glycosyltransferase family 4 protein n=1 Tax=uncultured Modestobacter sp. TaxID=380048 RepID=UPI002633DCBA|nr:glycosyltransferase family 1 protein [uncultured Modestobacter sp.]
MRIGLDATPLLGPRTGIGRYVEHLLAALAQPRSGDEFVATAFTARGAGGLAATLPAGVSARGRPVPARGLRWVWERSELLPVELLTGRLDVFHGTNFVLPPSGAVGVLTVHDLAYLRHRETVSADSARLPDLVGRGIARAAVVCTPSSAVAQEVLETYALPSDRVVVTPLGVDPSWAAARPLPTARSAELGLTEPYLLFVGNVEPRKNLPMLLRAYAAAHATSAGDLPTLALAGPAGWGPPLEVPPQLASRIVRLGYLGQAELQQVVAGARALVFPSRYEGFGLPPLEAFATGVPVLAADIAAVRETVGSLAHLVGPEDEDGWAAAMLATGGAHDAAGAEADRRAVAARYTWAATAQRTVDAYRRAADR